MMDVVRGVFHDSELLSKDNSELFRAGWARTP